MGCAPFNPAVLQWSVKTRTTKETKFSQMGSSPCSQLTVSNQYHGILLLSVEILSTKVSFLVAITLAKGVPEDRVTRSRRTFSDIFPDRVVLIPRLGSNTKLPQGSLSFQKSFCLHSGPRGPLKFHPLIIGKISESISASYFLLLTL